MSREQRLILFGPKKVGKTYFGKQFAQIHQFSFIDTDAYIEHLFDRIPIRTLYQQLGERTFRLVEQNTIFSIPYQLCQVISLGAGAALNPITVSFLKTQGLLVYLDAPYELLFKRIQQTGFPPFLAENPKESYVHQFVQRSKIYEAIGASKIFTNQSDTVVIQALTSLFYKFYGL